MDHIAVDANLAEPGRDRHGLMRDHPHFAAPTLGLHRKSDGRSVGRTQTFRFEPSDDGARYFIDEFIGAMKFDIGDRAQRRPYVLSVHPHDNGDQRPRERKSAQDFGALVGDVMMIDGDQAGVVGAGVETELA